MHKTATLPPNSWSHSGQANAPATSLRGLRRIKSISHVWAGDVHCRNLALFRALSFLCVCLCEGLSRCWREISYPAKMVLLSLPITLYLNTFWRVCFFNCGPTEPLQTDSVVLTAVCLENIGPRGFALTLSNPRDINESWQTDKGVCLYLKAI